MKPVFSWFAALSLFVALGGPVESDAVGQPPLACYPNCDESTGSPVLTANDFMCFVNAYGVGDPKANCDGSSVPPVLNAGDFICFVNEFAAGCSSSLRTVIYADGANGNDSTYVPGEPSRPRKTWPVQGDYGSISTTIYASGEGKFHGIRGLRTIEGARNISIQQWPGMPVWEARGDKCVWSGSAWARDEGNTYWWACVPESTYGICSVCVDWEETTFPGLDPEHPEISYNAGHYLRAPTLEVCRNTDQSWYYDAAQQKLFVTCGAIDLTVAGEAHCVHVCDGENSDLLRFDLCTNVSVSGLAAALAPTTAGTTGYAVKFESCGGELRVKGREGGGRLRDMGAHGIGFLRCTEASLCLASDLVMDGMRVDGSGVVWNTDRGMYARDVCVAEDVTQHFRRCLRADGTEVAVTHNAFQSVAYAHDEGLNLRIPNFIVRRWRAVYCPGYCQGQADPVPLSCETISPVAEADRFDPTKYQVQSVDGRIVNGTVYSNRFGSIHHLRPRFHFPRLGQSFGYNGYSISLQANNGVSRYLTFEAGEIIVNTDGPSAADLISVFSVQGFIGNLHDHIILLNCSCRNIGTQDATGLRGWIDYNRRGDNCFEVYGSVFEHNAADPHGVYGFAIQDHLPNVGVVRPMFENVYKGVAPGRYSQDSSFGGFAQWCVVDGGAVNLDGALLFPFAALHPPTLALDVSSALWTIRRQGPIGVPSCGINGAYTGCYGAYQYGGLRPQSLEPGPNHPVVRRP